MYWNYKSNKVNLLYSIYLYEKIINNYDNINNSNNYIIIITRCM